MKFIKRINPYILLLVLLELVLFAVNYAPHTWLVGWDNLMPELNFGLNFKRSLFSLWQEYRGLGLVDGMANSATLLHTTFLYLLSFLMPAHLLRYVFIHLTHLLGGIGFYFLVRYLLSLRGNSSEKIKGLFPPFLGALFYMLNIGIIQMYFAPLEVFAVHFAALPWLALVITKTLNKPNKKHFALLFLVALLTSPQGFVPTVFIAFLILFFFMLLFHLIRTRQFKLVLLTGLTVFLANAFWILPYGYSALKTPEVIANTRINQYGSEEIFYRNQAHGDLGSVLGLNGFMINTIEYDNTHQSDVFFMNAWKQYEASLAYQIPYVLILLIGIAGIVVIFHKREKEYYPYVAAFVVAFFFLANNTPGLEQANEFLRTVFPLLGEAFRFPFTKFITLFAFCLALFFALGVAALSTVLDIQHYRAHIKDLLHYAGGCILAIFILILAVPAFQGNFTSPFLRLQIPQDYFSLMDYLKTADQQTRIAVLPAHTFWNWHYRTWGHRGSGFLWYGVEQPMLERAFDPWSLKNEQYYNEMAQAIHSQDQKLLNSVLDKYDIGYVYVDQYVINTLSTQPINYNSLTTFLNNDPDLLPPETFGRLLLYPVKNHHDFTYALDGQPENIPALSDTRSDQAHLRFGDYISDTSQSATTTYLLPSLFTEKLQDDNSFTLTETSDTLTLTPKKQTLTLPQGSVLRVPDMFSTEFLIPVSLNVQDSNLIITPLYPQLLLNGKKIDLPVSPITVPLTLSGKPDKVTMTQLKHTVDLSSANSDTYLLGNTPDNTLIVQSGNEQQTITIDTTTTSKKDVLVPLPDAQISSIAYVLPKIQSPLSTTSIIKDRSYETQKNVDHLAPFAGDNAFAQAIHLGDQVTLRAKSATEELVFYKDNLFHQGSYLLLTNINYLQGLPINFYLDNPFEHRAELEQDFAKQDTTEITVIPATQDFFSGYGFHFTVKSVGTETGESAINSIELFPFPKRTIEQTAIVSPSQTAGGTKKEVTTSLSADHPQPMRYTLTMHGENTLVLSQSFAQGWNAYAFKTQPSFLQQIFPFLGGTRLTDHFVVNSWANGWSLPSPIQDSTSTIVIIYLPSYLQYFGLALTALGLLAVFILTVRIPAKLDKWRKSMV